MSLQIAILYDVHEALDGSSSYGMASMKRMHKMPYDFINYNYAKDRP